MNTSKTSSNNVLNALMGLCVGDALGVPVEFTSRKILHNNPVTDMLGFGTHNQPIGTWSDDSSLAFCLAESLCKGYNLDDIALQAVKWYSAGLWTPHGNVFDIGIATSTALHKIATGVSPKTSGGAGEYDNGNGSLMRILPIIFYLKDKPIQQRYQIIAEVSGITHRHIRSIFSCFIYCEYALLLLNGLEKFQALQVMQNTINEFLRANSVLDDIELNRFHRLLENPIDDYEIRPIYQYEEVEIASSGYVIHTLEASLWCLLTTSSYVEAVLKAVNLGEDTDTTGCVTGGLAGLYYGFNDIPSTWINAIARKQDIFDLANKLNGAY
ncbi:ADP-ribosylglycohydrolase family protein [Spirosoma foliorum]|uniref:ADP-ribosylglycohydrolase family protein n=1 Tax=Spirosoma foliorum TaxID=2710596 RepID=A0A7G5H029_9BACT|nr:ADP-ribosylglycohydrolase family protein [Spirosoma foliorum]QMW04471.1 ADP-ribosylglycohydrolase family protein [Spirosoma foliorum]